MVNYNLLIKETINKMLDGGTICPSYLTKGDHWNLMTRILDFEIRI